MTTTTLILDLITERPATVRELSAMTGISASIISATINRLRDRAKGGKTIYIKDWRMQRIGLRSQHVALWAYGKPRLMDMRPPEARTNSTLCREYCHRRKALQRASSVFSWCAAA